MWLSCTWLRKQLWRRICLLLPIHFKLACSSPFTFHSHSRILALSGSIGGLHLIPTASSLLSSGDQITSGCCILSLPPLTLMSYLHQPLTAFMKKDLYFLVIKLSVLRAASMFTWVNPPSCTSVYYSCIPIIRPLLLYALWQCALTSDNPVGILRESWL